MYVPTFVCMSCNVFLTLKVAAAYNRKCHVKNKDEKNSIVVTQNVININSFRTKYICFI